jgi:hypothetical protein
MKPSIALAVILITCAVGAPHAPAPPEATAAPSITAGTTASAPTELVAAERRATRPTPVAGQPPLPIAEPERPAPQLEQPVRQTRRVCRGGVCETQHVAVYSTGEYRWEGRRWVWHARPNRVQAKPLGEHRVVAAPVRAVGAVVRHLPIVRRLGR